MSIDETIRKALLPFGDPVENEIYLGDAKRYYTFSYASLGAAYADDRPNLERFLIQVHLFAPLSENIQQQKIETKRALFFAGLGWPETQSLTDEDARHIVFECEAVKEVFYGDT